MNKSQWIQNEQGAHRNLILGVHCCFGFIFALYMKLSQNVTDIITKSDSYFIEKRRNFMTKCNAFITKCDVYYKVCYSVNIAGRS